MLLYLSTNTRPDIAFAVSQVCRFTSNPKKSHASAVKMILRYLKGTMDKGMIIRPTKNLLELNLYVDADFCGLFKQEDPRHEDAAKSRTGYIIILGGWPMVWKSVLQDGSSQSTTEAEYCALSTALRVLLPLQRLIKAIVDRCPSPKFEGSLLHSTAFEDNQSAYYLATNQKITNRTRYYLTKWHWFWEQYRNKEFAITKCPTAEQQADYLTKPLALPEFRNNRSLVQGW